MLAESGVLEEGNKNIGTLGRDPLYERSKLPTTASIAPCIVVRGKQPQKGLFSSSMAAVQKLTPRKVAMEGSIAEMAELKAAQC